MFKFIDINKLYSRTLNTDYTFEESLYIFRAWERKNANKLTHLYIIRDNDNSNSVDNYSDNDNYSYNKKEE